MRHESGLKYLPAPELITLLDQLPAGALVTVNTIGNLLVMDKTLHAIGYVNVATGELELYDAPEDLIDTRPA